ncbi:P40 [Diatraea saccharalis granulovirus]|uniref:p40 n=1 Tax=Diatraea saccharalis granulovirus TaxID=1675862 RepID=A0A0R7EYT1_9BBAC|nr:P40 [Diatraea saccharalis granulovirus]AKN80736.1 P40 [Diatraea saccharalis granulovirus]
MSSARTRLFLMIEKLKNAMEDPQMSFPFWEKFFPLLGSSTEISLPVATLSELLNEAAEVAEQTILTQGSVLFSQFIQGNETTTNTTTTTNNNINNNNVNSLRRLFTPTPSTSSGFDAKKYHTYAEKMATYFTSASVSSAVYTVKDIVKLYMYISHVSKYKPLFEVLEPALFRKERECTPPIQDSSLVLDCLRDLTMITNIRLDYEALMVMITSVQRALDNVLVKYPHVKVSELISSVNVNEKAISPSQAYGAKFELLLEQKPMSVVDAIDNPITFNENPTLIESIAANIEMNCDINRMVFNSINNIFINAVEQSAAENIEFDVADFNKRYRVLERIRDNLRVNRVDKIAVGETSIKKKIESDKSTADIFEKNPCISTRVIYLRYFL